MTPWVGDDTGGAGRAGPAGQAGDDQRRRFARGRDRSAGPVPQRNSNLRHGSTRLTVVDSARRLKMAPYFESGDFRPLPITATYSLDDAASAYRAVADHVPGRVVIRS